MTDRRINVGHKDKEEEKPFKSNAITSTFPDSIGSCGVWGNRDWGSVFLLIIIIIIFIGVVGGKGCLFANKRVFLVQPHCPRSDGNTHEWVLTKANKGRGKKMDCVFCMAHEISKTMKNFFCGLAPPPKKTGEKGVPIEGGSDAAGGGILRKCRGGQLVDWHIQSIIGLHGGDFSEQMDWGGSIAGGKRWGRVETGS